MAYFHKNKHHIVFLRSSGKRISTFNIHPDTHTYDWEKRGFSDRLTIMPKGDLTSYHQITISPTTYECIQKTLGLNNGTHVFLNKNTRMCHFKKYYFGALTDDIFNTHGYYKHVHYKKEGPNFIPDKIYSKRTYQNGNKIITDLTIEKGQITGTRTKIDPHGRIQKKDTLSGYLEQRSPNDPTPDFAPDGYNVHVNVNGLVQVFDEKGHETKYLFQNGRCKINLTAVRRIKYGVLAILALGFCLSQISHCSSNKPQKSANHKAIPVQLNMLYTHIRH